MDLGATGSIWIPYFAITCIESIQLIWLIMTAFFENSFLIWRTLLRYSGNNYTADLLSGEYSLDDVSDLLKKIVHELLGYFIFLEAVCSDLSWQTDFVKTKPPAKEKQQYILLNFSGSDWCGTCIRQHNEIFGSDAFKYVSSKRSISAFIDVLNIALYADNK